MMDVGQIIKNLPPTEKLFGGAWILCWIIAIWIYHLQFFITGIFFLVLAILLSYDFSKEDNKNSGVLAVFSMDKNTRTLKVQKVYEDNLKWEEHEICSGVAKLPVGHIKEGDVVTNCDGNVALRHIPSNKIMGAYNFEKKE